MITKTFSAGDDLADVLLNNSLTETTGYSDRIKGKREFRKSRSGKKKICLDYINVIVMETFSHDKKISLSTDDVKAMIFFLKVDKIDFLTIIPDGEFGFEKVQSGIREAGKKLALHRDFPQVRMPALKMRRAIDIYNQVLIL